MVTARRIAGFVVVVGVMLGLAPVGQAWACSCAEMTIQEVEQREPGAAVARVRRVDDGGSEGVGEVVEVLHGPDLPDEVQLALDDGASCRPWVTVGELAVLTLVPDGESWRTLECGQLDPATGLDPIAVDPDAAGPPAIVVFGQLPGAGLAALDDRLRVLAVTDGDTYVMQVERCGNDLVLVGHDAQGRVLFSRLELPALAQTAHYVPFPDPEVAGEHLGLDCREDGTVDLLLRAHGGQQESQLHRDVFGEPVTSTLPDSSSAAFAGDRVVFLQPAGSSDGPLTLTSLDPATGHRRRILQHPAVGREITVSPDGGHAVIRGFDDEPVALAVDLESGEVVGESRGWWQPIQRPWLGDDRILFRDENSGGMDGNGVTPFRIVDLSLQEVAAVPAIPTRSISAFPGSLVATSSEGLTVLDANAQPVRTVAYPWLVAANGTLQLQAVEPDPEAELLTVVETVQAPDAGTGRSVATPASGETARLAWALAAGLVATLTLGAFLVRRRRGTA